MGVYAHKMYINVLSEQMTLLLYKEQVKITSSMFADNNQMKHVQLATWHILQISGWFVMPGNQNKWLAIQKNYVIICL